MCIDWFTKQDPKDEFMLDFYNEPVCVCYLCLSPSEQLTVSQSLLSDIFPNIYPLTSNKSAASNMQMASKKSCQTISKLMHNNAYTAPLLLHIGLYFLLRTSLGA